jgi:hypothetical protein
MKKAVFWDVVSYRYCVKGRFGGKYRLHLQGRRKEKGRNPRTNQREQVQTVFKLFDVYQDITNG